MSKLSSPVLVSGAINFPTLTTKMDEKEYAAAKVYMWMYMLNEGEVPTKWFKPNTKGTKVNFDYVSSQEEYNQGLEDLRTYIDEVNNKYDFGFKIQKQLENIK